MAPDGDFATPTRVLVVVQSGLIREGLCRLLERITDIEVVASIGYLHGLEAIARQRQIDVALIDAYLPGEACFDVPRRLQESGVATSVVILSVSNGIGDVRRALASGASGFLLQDAGMEELEMAVHAAATGETFLCPTIIRQLAEGASLSDIWTQEKPVVGGASRYPRVEAMVDEALRRGILREG